MTSALQAKATAHEQELLELETRLKLEQSHALRVSQLELETSLRTEMEELRAALARARGLQEGISAEMTGDCAGLVETAQIADLTATVDSLLQDKAALTEQVD